MLARELKLAGPRSTTRPQEKRQRCLGGKRFVLVAIALPDVLLGVLSPR
jgi:hypothetical protein